ncbi:gamma interferon inducible lysosomal thiol reductase GILT protein [Ceratobasidium sp. AG-Ba]|nr:gamma interferon inducible lysosomal thiol reductase GILT protein [Ceratobasidium sp. AG-Ba]
MLSLLLFPLLVSAAVVPELIQQNELTLNVQEVKVPVTLGVMSRCPDAIACETVFDKVLERVGNRVDMSLAFIGTINASEPLYGVTCMHGEFECAGNVHELCAIAHTSSQEQWWPFLRCLNYQGRSHIGDENMAKKCARIVGLDWDQSGIGACVGGDEGKRLLHESVEYSKHEHIRTSCTMIINGRVRCIRDGTWKECDGGHEPADFVRRINSEYDKLNSKKHKDNVTDV